MKTKDPTPPPPAKRRARIVPFVHRSSQAVRALRKPPALQLVPDAMKPKLHTIISGYFPNALEAIAHHAQYGNDKHNPGERLHWAFHKSTEHAESAQRHLQKAGTIDPETGKSHTIGLAIRALMLLETELLAAGAEPGWAVDMGEPCAEPCEACEEATEPYEAPPERWRVLFLGAPSCDCTGEFPSEEAAKEAIRNNPRRQKESRLSDWRPEKLP